MTCYHMIDPKGVGGDTPPLKFSEYLNMVFDTPEIQSLLRGIVKRFVRYWLVQGPTRERGPLWNLQTKELRTLDNILNRMVLEDIHMQGHTVNLGV